MANKEDQEAAKVLREVENRLVWMATFLVIRACYGSSGNNGAAEAADLALDTYQTKFPPIQPG